ncbi:MAG: hypothetical protein ACFNJR_07515, partial [Segatella oulorum]|uniref:hypothetical protein n=1 Tax=Segatella oulorum TaxID=28136 RepID=UPI00361D842E
FGLATLRRRKNPLFLDMQPCGAEKSCRYVCRNAASTNAQIKKQASRDGCLLFNVGLPPAS